MCTKLSKTQSAKLYQMAAFNQKLPKPSQPEYVKMNTVDQNRPK